MLKKALAIAAVTALSLSGCSGDGETASPTDTAAHRILQGAAPGEANTTLTAMPDLPDMVSDADLDFVRMMLPHHLQALEMTRLVPDRTSREDVPLFAERIELSQEEEIEIMQDWLRARGEPIHDLTRSGGHHHGPEEMPGMLTPAQLAELAAADGEEFDVLFLKSMYLHHQGAVTMVEDLYAADGAQDQFIFDLAKDIDGDQRIEMDRIVGMLAELGEEPPGTGR